MTRPGGSAAAYNNALIMRKYHEVNGELEQRDEIITTIFSHPCDAACPATAGFRVVTLYPEEDGLPSTDALKTGAIDTILPGKVLRETPPGLPELSQAQVLRHYLRLSQMTLGMELGIDIGVGTCTMKYSPKVNEGLAALIADVHPLQPEGTLQGLLEIPAPIPSFRNWGRALSTASRRCTRRRS